jgi:uncharacterized damage-inducible protein DinB
MQSQGLAERLGIVRVPAWYAASRLKFPEETPEMRRTILAVAVFALLPFAVRAQQSSRARSEAEPNPVSSTLRKVVERQSKNIVAAAEALPPEKYNFRPTPEQMTFAHLMIHIVGSNIHFCSAISDSPAPAEEKLEETMPKEKLVASLKSSFDYCTQALGKVDDSNLGAQVPGFGGHTISRAAAMIGLASSYSDHYGAAAMYLRLNGVLPPTAQQQHH